MCEVLDNVKFCDNLLLLIVVLGKDIVGELVVVDLVKMLYLLVVGIIGFGKFVGVNVMILSMFYKV